MGLTIPILTHFSYSLSAGLGTHLICLNTRDLHVQFHLPEVYPLGDAWCPVTQLTSMQDLSWKWTSVGLSAFTSELAIFHGPQLRCTLGDKCSFLCTRP